MIMWTGHVALRYEDRCTGDSWIKASFSAVRGRMQQMDNIPEFQNSAVRLYIQQQLAHEVMGEYR
jgi:hypothetical protein